MKDWLWFLARFLAVTPLVAGLWWLVMPVYLWGLGQGAAATLRTVMRQPIEGVRVERAESTLAMPSLAFESEGKLKTMPQAWSLVSNIAPFIALTLATAGLAPRRRLRILAIGCAILCLGHYIYIVLAFLMQRGIAAAPAIPTVVGQIFITLPFLLWILLAYWPSANQSGTAETQT